MNADGTNQTALTDDPAEDSDAEWSPNGRFIAFNSNRGEGCGGFYAMNADGTGVTQIESNTCREGNPCCDFNVAWGRGRLK